MVSFKGGTFKTAAITTEITELTDEYQSGRAAYRGHADENTNPHEVGSPSWARWLLGWRAARDEEYQGTCPEAVQTAEGWKPLG